MIDDAPRKDGINIPDLEIIERFGGIRPMASKLGVAVTTVQGWKERAHIPGGRTQQILAAAAEHGVDLGGGAPASEAVETAPPPPPPPPEHEPEPEPEPEPAPEPEKVPEPTVEPVREPDFKEPAPAPEAKPAEAERPPARSGGGVAWVAFLLALILIAGLLTRPYWEPFLHPGSQSGAVPVVDNTRLDGLATDLGEIEKLLDSMTRETETRDRALGERVGALEAGGGETGAAFAEQLSQLSGELDTLGRNLDSLGGSLSKLEDRLASLEAAQGSVPESVKAEIGRIGGEIDGLREEMAAQAGNLSSEVDALTSLSTAIESRVGELESRPVQTGEKIAALALAIGQVEQALAGGRSYRSALDRLYALGRDDPLITDGEAMAALAPWADYGIPDRLALQRRFFELSPSIARELAGTAEDSWLDSIWNNVKGMVSVRRIDGAGDSSPLTRAEIALEQGDLVATAAAFEGTGSLGAEGEAWLNLVRNRVEAEQAIETLYGQVVAPLAGTTSGEGATQ